MDRPQSVFKYEPFALRAIQNLKASSVYFGSPAGFNDPYDCALTASIAPTSQEELEQLRVAAISSSAYPKDAKDRIPSLSLEEFESQVVAGARIVLDRGRDEFLNKRGATCFSEVNDNLLMWSHYGGQYKGYCLEFDTTLKPFNMVRKVQYVDQMPQFQLRDFVLNENHEQFAEMFFTKSLAWSYEKEWRVLHDEAGTLFGYPREALKAIFFGPDISDQDRDLLCLIAHGQFPDAELWIGKRSTAEFKVEFSKAPGYLPYAEARRRSIHND